MLVHVIRKVYGGIGRWEFSFRERINIVTARDLVDILAL
jgi:hypothetical protein